MEHRPRPTAPDAERVVAAYGAKLYRMALVQLCSVPDAEDAVQTALLKYMEKAPVFHSQAHEKAWLITVTVNVCRDILRFRTAHPSLDETVEREAEEEESDGCILCALTALAPEYREPLYLYYVEGYETKEIGRLLQLTAAAVRKRLQRGRELLRLEYERGEQA